MISLSFLMTVVTLLVVSVLSGWSWVMEFSIMNLGTMNMSISMFLESHTSMFLLSVLLIFVMVYIYSYSYLSEEVYLKRFLSILSLFVASMCFMILSSSLFSSLIGWDGLGVTSLFLILFYYSKSALKASTLTFLTNRVGDCLFILTLTQILLMSETQILHSCSSFGESIAFLFILTSITKSAQIPFSTWLPAAMEAPTPVSALVHSSTLVTAGIFLLYRYSLLWIDSDLKDLLMILSVGTCFMAALSALVENDLKKLIALSTLSQLGFIMFSMSLGLLAQGFLHMLMHAYFKALLFMCAGLIIHSFKGSQSIMSMSMSEGQNPLLMTIMSCSLMSMSGLPFLSGFYSKDLIIDSIKSTQWSFIILVLLILSFMCTAMYSLRSIWYLLNSSMSWHSMSDSDLGMIKPMLPLAMLSALGGSMSTWLMADEVMYVDSSKVMILVLLVMVSGSYWMWKEVSSSAFLEKKWNLAIINHVLCNLFFHVTATYKNSSDLLGIPEIINKQVKWVLYNSSCKLTKTMLHYSGSTELLVFLVILMMLT